jgi:V-type H+-transporting ATPase subunit a
MGKTFMLDPGNVTQYKGDPYYLGVDPGWQMGTNKITFLNTYKMKISLIFGLIHMFFGLTLSLWNKIIKKTYADIFLEFIPQVVFLTFLFGYLVSYFACTTVACLARRDSVISRGRFD